MQDPISRINVGRVNCIFGRNSIKNLPDELRKLRISKPILITDNVLLRLGTVELLTSLLREQKIEYEIYSNITAEPENHLVDEALALLRQAGCDGVIGLGGGSVMDTAKCVAGIASNSGRMADYDRANPDHIDFEKDCLPIINIPTTSGTGAELSPYAVITNEEQHRKAGVSSPKLLSHTILVDPLLVRGLPKTPTAACGCDALAHCIEALTSTKSLQAPNPIIDALAVEGIGLLYQYLPRAWADGEDLEAREKVCWAASIGGIVLQYGSGAAHGMSNVLGGMYHIPHGNAIGMFLPHVLRFNVETCADRYALVAQKLGMRDARQTVESIASMIESFELPRLSAYVKDPGALEEIARQAVQDKCTRYNGRPVGPEDARALLEKAY